MWAGTSSFFGTLLTLGIIDAFDIRDWPRYLGAILISGMTAGTVYSRARLYDAKKEAKTNR